MGKFRSHKLPVFSIGTPRLFMFEFRTCSQTFLVVEEIGLSHPILPDFVISFHFNDSRGCNSGEGGILWTRAPA